MKPRGSSYLLLVGLFSCASLKARHVASEELSSYELSWSDRYQRRNFPSLFSPWASADHLNTGQAGSPVSFSKIETPVFTLCRHDLIWTGPSALGLKFNQKYQGL